MGRGFQFEAAEPVGAVGSGVAAGAVAAAVVGGGAIVLL